MRTIPRHSKVSNIYRIKSLKADAVLRCESEAEVGECIRQEFDNNTISYMTQPFTISYLFNGKKRKYTPDLLVKRVDGIWRVIEVKPFEQIEGLKEKFEVLRRIFASAGMQFVIVSDKEIYAQDTYHSLTRKYQEKMYA
ncbi:Tn7 transposase TnsA N-terminal domain-containing protein [Photobacterium kasasachensis]|uniref:Tn7 transposase TnsA N-terminal domain-containing protein n=1 Tax=Photobacterium kasasachensis TaxID=2910240 RepID=UPI003D0FA7AA